MIYNHNISSLEGTQNLKNIIIMLARQKNHLTTLDLTGLISNSSQPQILSVLYSNRGVLYYESGNYQWALNDLNKALQLNHLNYAAYFNLFSILYQSRPEEASYRQESLKNLCCALSCLYLMRGKKRNNESDVSKCVKLAENNCQGRLLRALQYYKKQKHTLALNQLKWVLDLQPSNLEILRIKKIIQSKLRDLGKGRYNQAQDQEDELKQQQSNQFSENGSKRLKCSLYQNTLEDQQFDIDEQIKAKMIQFEVLFKDIFGKLVSSHNMADGKHKLILSLNRYNQKSDNQFQEASKQVVREKEDENLISNQFIQSDTVEEENGLNAYLVGSRNKNSSRSSFEGSTNSFLTIIARDDESKRINVKVGKIRIVEQESQTLQSNNLYCSFQFGEPKLHLIMSTPESGMNINKRKCEEEDDFKILKVKVFNKQILSFKDRFIGQGQDEIKGPGKYNIVLYNHSEQGMEDVGYVEIYVQFV